MYIYPEYFEASCLITFASSKVALLIFYLAQEILQNFYNKISEYGENDLLFRIILFFLRAFYANTLSFAAILQYRSYWDFYNGKILQKSNTINMKIIVYVLEMTTSIDYRYFFALSIITVLAYRYILEEDFGYYAKTVPFELVIDEEFETYFYLNSYIKLNDV